MSTQLHLEKLTAFAGRRGPLLLAIMDGVGLAPAGPGNAVALANTPVLDELLSGRCHTRLFAHGTHVGLPSDAEMGNSEVGHNTLGGGRIFAQGAKLVQQAFADGSIYQSDVWREVESRGVGGASVHLLGLLSDGNVHSHIAHLFDLIERCRQAGIKSVCVHALLDGRDVAPRSAPEYVAQLREKLDAVNQQRGFDYRIASGGGRMAITMDRYQADWPMVKRGWDAHVHGKARAVQDVAAEIQRQYDADSSMNDQYLQPFVVADSDGKPRGAVRDGDAVVLFNFRGDRAIEISRAFCESEFDAFARGDAPDAYFCGMLEYDGDLGLPPNYLVAAPKIERSMSEFLCAEKIKTFAVSETQKFGHVTYFWNGNRSERLDESLETWVEIPSGASAFHLAPQMKANEITAKTIELLTDGQHRFGRINFANGDMVGHSGDLDATIKAVETVDHCLGQLREAVQQCGGVLVVTADHGNADEMFIEKNGERIVRTAHSLNQVPFAICDSQNDNAYRMADVDNPGLANVAATLFNLLGYRAPADYFPSLIAFDR